MHKGSAIRNIAILADPRDDEKRKVLQAAVDDLRRHCDRLDIGVQTFIGDAVEDIKPDTDVNCLVVLGGDGSMIHYAARLAHLGLPYYGLNFGNVGFMMNNHDEGLAVHARQMKDGDYVVWEFPVLRVKATDQQGELHEGVGLNDIYLQRMTPQSCKAEIIIDGVPLHINPILCDGIIVATPLGSTAYNFNVTGSLAAVSAPVIALTPVAAARTCPVSTMVLPMDVVIEYKILEPLKRRVMVVSDGQSHGDLIHAKIDLSPHRVRLCFNPEYSSRALPVRFINKALG